MFSRSADHEQDWQPYPVDPYSAMCDDHTTYIHTMTYCRESAGAGTVVLKAVPVTGAAKMKIRWYRDVIVVHVITVSLGCPTELVKQFPYKIGRIPKELNSETVLFP